jgi:hypothetical protein
MQTEVHAIAASVMYANTNGEGTPRKLATANSENS